MPNNHNKMMKKTALAQKQALRNFNRNNKGPRPHSFNGVGLFNRPFSNNSKPKSLQKAVKIVDIPDAKGYNDNLVLSDQYAATKGLNVSGVPVENLSEALTRDLATTINSMNERYKSKSIPTQDQNTDNNNSKLSYKQKTLSPGDAIKLINTRQYKLVSLDIEMFEFSKDKITEIGLSIYNPAYQTNAFFPHILNLHLLPREYYGLENRVFCPGAKREAMGCQSEIIVSTQIPAVFERLFEKLGSDTIIVGHQVEGDLKALSSFMNVEFPDYLKIIDTKSLWHSLVQSSSKNAKSSLSYVLEKLNIPHAFMHNAVNDSYYTLVACLMMSSPSFINNSKAVTGFPDPSGTSPSTATDIMNDNQAAPTPVKLKFNPPEEVINQKLVKRRGSRKNPLPKNSFFEHGKYSTKDFDDKLDDLMSKL